MYDVNLSDEARDAAAHVPHDSLKALAELVDLLILDPYVGRLYRGPGSDLRSIAIADGKLPVVCLVLEAQQRVELLRLLWLGEQEDG